MDSVLKKYSSGLKSQESDWNPSFLHEAMTLITGTTFVSFLQFFDLSYFDRFGCSEAVNSVQSIRDPLYTLY